MITFLIILIETCDYFENKKKKEKKRKKSNQIEKLK